MYTTLLFHIEVLYNEQKAKWFESARFIDKYNNVDVNLQL